MANENVKECDEIIREIELEQYKVKNFLKAINSEA